MSKRDDDFRYWVNAPAEAWEAERARIIARIDKYQRQSDIAVKVSAVFFAIAIGICAVRLVLAVVA